ncbi:MAG: CPBP family intramembrane metalloprotease [Burkholderiales bacterium]|nr:CPBP family intramembrane metalloprotease [Burkholderiales bacterium]
MSKPRSPYTVIGLLLTLGLGSLPYPVWDNEYAGPLHMVGNEAIYWALVALVVLYVLRIEKRPLASIGIRPMAGRDWPIAIGFAAIMIVGIGTILLVVLPAIGLDEHKQINHLQSAPVWWLVISVIRAGVSEEVLFRGYPIERLQAWTGSRTVAVLIPLVIFAGAHVGPWGWGHLLVAGFGGAVLTLQYLWRRNLLANMLTHCIVDMVGVFA